MKKVGAFDQIPLKTQSKTRYYRLNSATIFYHDVYERRINVESDIICNKKKIQ